MVVVENNDWPELLASDGFPAMETSPGYLIRRAQQVHAGLWQKHVRRSLTSVQFGVLLVIDQGHEIDQTAVGALMSLDKNTVTDVLCRLRSRGLVFSRRDPADGRRMLTRLSDAGRAALQAATPGVKVIQDRLLGPMRSGEKEIFRDLLRKAAYRGRPPDTELATPRSPLVVGRAMLPPTLRLDMAPGHLIRRIQQLHTMYWLAAVSTELTSPQFSVLLVLHRQVPMSQALLGECCYLDRATAADVLSRMQQGGLICRIRDDVDGRRYNLTLSASGRRTLSKHVGGVLNVQRRLMEPLTPSQRLSLMALMAKVVRVDVPTPDR